MSSIFSRIIAGEIPCTKTYEDDICFGFLDINPKRPGHMLLVPKEEYQRMRQVPDDILQHMFLTCKKLMKELIADENTNTDYVELLIEGLEVPHFHIHLIPGCIQQENH